MGNVLAYILFTVCLGAMTGEGIHAYKHSTMKPRSGEYWSPHDKIDQNGDVTR